jgi:uncharacterized protein (TIGR02118 family)
MIKLVFCVKKRKDISTDEFYDYWLNQHGPLVKSKAELLQITRYVQSHTQKPELGEAVSAARGMKQPGFDGIAELWFDSMESLEALLATDAAREASAALAEDEARFIDMEGSTIFYTEEHEVIPGA